MNQEYPGRVVPLSTLKLVRARRWEGQPAAPDRPIPAAPHFPPAIQLRSRRASTPNRHPLPPQYDELGYRVHVHDFHGPYVSPLDFRQYAADNMKDGSLLNIYLTRKSGCLS